MFITKPGAWYLAHVFHQETAMQRRQRRSKNYLVHIDPTNTSRAIVRTPLPVLRITKRCVTARAPRRIGSRRVLGDEKEGRGPSLISITLYMVSFFLALMRYSNWYTSPPGALISPKAPSSSHSLPASREAGKVSRVTRALPIYCGIYEMQLSLIHI